MTPERWQQVKEILQGALQQEPEERPAFIAQACQTDPALRSEVESLLASESGFDKNFLPSATTNRIALRRGVRLGPYEIVTLIGAGGMGEVYHALDTRLNRGVAIKVLPSSLSCNAERRHRLRREARAISSLQHPNICTLFDIGEHDGVEYIVMEFLEGQSLAALLQNGRLTLDASLRYADEIADALDCAHRRGVVHRDVKPANIFITARGETKVLDFGLAKLEVSENDDLISSAAGLDLNALSIVGVPMGTAAYMSPEQARGEELDWRTDIFSLGAVLYEMVTGKLAFPGKTPAIMFRAILDATPMPPSQMVRSLPAQLDFLIEKALEKDRELRYQSAADLRTDLKSIPRKRDSERLEAAISMALKPRVRFRRGTTIGFVVALLLFTGLSAIVHWWEAPPHLNLQNMTMTRLTDIGEIGVLALSPDGRFLAYSLTSSQESLWIRQIAPESKVQVIPPSPDVIGAVGFSPDGNYLYFVRNANGYVIPALGGTPRLIIKDTFGDIGVSPDGKKLAYIHGGDAPKSQLIVVNRDGTGENVIAEHPLGSGIRFNTTAAPSWSPDGKFIAMPAIRQTDYVLNIYPVEGGSQKTIPLPGSVIQAVWLPDQSGLLINSSSTFTSPPQIWVQPFPNGSIQRLTNDLDSYWSLSLSRDGRLLAAAQSQETYTTYVSPASKPEQGTVITKGKSDGIGLGWMPDGALLSQSVDSEFLVLTPDGKHRTSLLKDEVFKGCFSVCRNGRYIILGRAGLGDQQDTIWRADITGNNLKQLTPGPRDLAPDCSPDGQYVTYLSGPDFRPRRVAIDGGATFAVTNKSAVGVRYSPDGREIADIEPRQKIDKDPSDEFLLIVRDLRTGHVTKSFDLPPRIGIPFNSAGWILRWTPDGRFLTYALWSGVGGGVANLWRQSLSGGPPRQITHFSDTIVAYDWSPDGKQLAFTRRTDSSDVVLITNFR